MKLTLTQFVTLDGVCRGPGSPDEDTSDGFTRGGWMVPHMDQTFIGIAAGWLERAGALLLGRRTYEAFAQAWPQIDGPALGRRVTDTTTTPGGLTILVFEATGPAAFSTYEGVGAVGA